MFCTSVHSFFVYKMGRSHGMDDFSKIYFQEM
jgi:hypothetical protein